jgi:ubiquinone/menaquinone biosynthesis C-methylase UbiE
MSEPAGLERIRAQFARQARAYAEMQQTRDARGLAALVAISGAQPADAVLDVACGPGLLTLAFAERCASAVGVDATEELLALARQEAQRRGIENAEFRSGDAERLPFPAARFDVVACRAAFHHFPRPERVLAEMSRVAKPGARLLIADMLGSTDPAKAERHDEIERLCDPTHVRALPERDFEALFRAAGLTPLLRPKSTLDYDLEEWMVHGGPDDAARAQIVARMEASLACDDADLRVRREAGRLRFTHQTAAFVLRTPS